ncbi:hypothetical protein [Chryseobacterium sp.]|nr:hypothetical protein [Chryseobacterium sp.]
MNNSKSELENSVVTKEVPANTILVREPGRTKRSLDETGKITYL